jgi:hypothetical protein
MIAFILNNQTIVHGYLPRTCSENSHFAQGQGFVCVLDLHDDIASLDTAILALYVSMGAYRSRVNAARWVASHHRCAGLIRGHTHVHVSQPITCQHTHCRCTQRMVQACSFPESSKDRHSLLHGLMSVGRMHVHHMQLYVVLHPVLIISRQTAAMLIPKLARCLQFLASTRNRTHDQKQSTWQQIIKISSVKY